MGSSGPNAVKVQILPATEDDFVTLASVESIANHNMIKTKPENNIARIIFGPPSEESWHNRAKGLIETSQKDPNSRHYKAVVEESDGSQKIVGWANWFFKTDDGEVEDWKDIEWPPSVNNEAANLIIGELRRLRRRQMANKRHAFLEVLATLPEYRGLGAGSGLLQRGIDDAIKEGLDDFYLSASKDGYDIYAKFGYRDLEPVGISLEQFGGSGNVPIITMRKIGHSK